MLYLKLVCYISIISQQIIIHNIVYNIIYIVNRKTQKGKEKIFTIHIADKGLVLQMEEALQLSNKSNPIF